MKNMISMEWFTGMAASMLILARSILIEVPAK